MFSRVSSGFLIFPCTTVFPLGLGCSVASTTTYSVHSVDHHYMLWYHYMLCVLTPRPLHLVFWHSSCAARLLLFAHARLILILRPDLKRRPKTPPPPRKRREEKKDKRVRERRKKRREEEPILA